MSLRQQILRFPQDRVLNFVILSTRRVIYFFIVRLNEKCRNLLVCESAVKKMVARQGYRQLVTSTGPHSDWGCRRNLSYKRRNFIVSRAFQCYATR